jgi:beta-lactamase superfamily II metal-dependent hydrolase
LVIIHLTYRTIRILLAGDAETRDECTVSCPYTRL